MADGLDWIREGLKKDGKTQSGLAKALGRHPSAITDMLQGGRRLKADEIPVIAEYLGVAPPAFRASPLKRVPAGQEFAPDPDPDVEMTIGSETGRRGIPPDGSAELRVTGGLADAGGMTIITDGIARGDGMTFSGEVVRDWWRLPRWMLGRFNADPEHIICFPVRGGSMTPTIRENDVVFVDTRHRVPSPAGLYALADEFGGLIVKRLEVTSSRSATEITIRIKSDNPEHLTRELPIEEISIIGIVVGKFTMPEQ